MRSLQHKEIHKNPESFTLPSKGTLIMKCDISRFFNVLLEFLRGKHTVYVHGFHLLVMAANHTTALAERQMSEPHNRALHALFSES